MKLIKAIVAAAAVFAVSTQAAVNVFAAEGVQPLQAYFADNGKTMKIFTSEPLDSNANLLIGNETLTAEAVASDVKIMTTFLVDNSTSMPYSLRDEVKTAISSYVSSMPDTESVKIAMFDTKTTILADEYSNDKEFISYELSKIDFQGQASLVYDAVLNVSESADTSVDAYYRTILITDGIDSVEGTSFDYLRSVISENGRYHVDVVQVSESKKQDVNLNAIANLGSNTFTLFNSGANFDALKPDTVSMIKVKLNNTVTTGELKGVTIKNGGSNISLGSIMFPQVEIEEPKPTETKIVAQTTASVTEAAKDTTVAATSASTTTASNANDEENGFPFILVIAIVGGCFLVGGALITVVLLKKKKVKKCSISVQICKEDERDQKGVGMDLWQFAINSEFRVGRTLEPKSNDNSPLPKNQRAICENATNDDISSIGRNAFALTYDKKLNTIIIKNVAQGAIFSVETGGRKNDLRAGQTDTIMKGTKILLGNYTTVIVHNFTVNG
ncbi:MAG: VWA domain-containing protein [Ruminococcus flavefaciens]|nr:VWA domain-containing protein [Ruminococcus flavefaciens]